MNARADQSAYLPYPLLVNDDVHFRVHFDERLIKRPSNVGWLNKLLFKQEGSLAFLVLLLTTNKL